MPAVRAYPQVFEVDATDGVILDRIGVGTVFIEGDDIFPTPIGYPKTISVTTYTVQSIDNGQTLDFVNPAASTALVPPNLEPEGFECYISQGGTGQVTVQPHAGSSLVNEDGFFSTDKQYGELKLKQFSASAYRLFGRTSGGTAVPAQQITNYFGPQLGDAAINMGYGASAGSGQGVPVTLNGFTTTGLIPVTPGTTYTIDLYAAGANWIFNTSSSADGVFCYSATPATHAHLTDLLTYAGSATFTTDGLSVTFTVPMDTTAFVALNVKWVQGGSFISGRPVPSGVISGLLNGIMLNKSTAAVVQSAFGATGTVDTVTTALGLQAGQMGTIFNGQWAGDQLVQGFIYNRIPWTGGKDLVQRYQYFAENYYNNNNFEPASICLIPSSTPGPSTPGAFGAQFSPNTITSTNIYVQSDNALPMVLDGAKGIGGAHGILCLLVPATSHGLVNANRGAIYTDGVTQFTVARIGQLTGGDPNNLILMPPIAGPETNWSYAAPAISGTTLTHVSGGGSPPATVTITGSPASQELYPANQNATISFAFNGGQFPASNGVYVDTGTWTYIDYDIPNAFDIQAAVFALTGVSTDTPAQYNTAASQIHNSTQYFYDPYGATTVYYNITALQSYNRNGMWPSQSQGGVDMANFGAGQKFLYFQEGVLPYAPNFPQSGSTVDFSTFPDMTANVNEYWGLATNWQPASYYADNQPHNATFAIGGVQDSGSNWLRKWCIANDDVDGRSASADPTFIPQSYLFTAADKMYMPTANIEGNAATAFNTQVPQGTIDLSVGGFGFQHPALTDNANSYGSFAYTKGGGALAWRWYTASTLTNYAIPVRPDMIGRSIQIIKQAATVTVLDAVVTDSGVHVTTTGPGGFSAILS